MGFEVWNYNEQEKKKKELKEKEKEKAIFFKKQIEQQKTNEYIDTETKTEDNLNKLHDLVDEGFLTKQQAEHIADWDELTKDEVQEIFDKIDEIEDIKDVDKYLPVELRITKQDYTQAMIDDVFRVQTIIKLDTALWIIAQEINPGSSAWINIFTSFLSILDKNLILIQEHTLDIKNNLNYIDNKSIKLNLWNDFLNSCKWLFKW